MRHPSLRLISRSELRPGDFVAVWCGTSGTSKSNYDYFFIVDVVTLGSGKQSVLMLSTTRGTGVEVIEDLDTKSAVFTSKGVLYRDILMTVQSGSSP